MLNDDFVKGGVHAECATDDTNVLVEQPFFKTFKKRSACCLDDGVVVTITGQYNGLRCMVNNTRTTRLLSRTRHHRLHEQEHDCDSVSNTGIDL